MYRYAIHDLQELAHQLLLSPRRMRLGQVQGIDKLLGLIEQDKSYPYDWVCFGITGYRRRGSLRGEERRSIPGGKLIVDLITMAEEISRKSALTQTELGQAFLSQEDLATSLKVSTKTIRRWRARGLMGLRVVCPDGINRLVFCKSTVDRFVNQNGDMVQRGASFNQLSTDEKDRLVLRARELLAGRRMKLHALARLLAAETGRAIETVRYTLRAYDRAHPSDALFDAKGHPMLGARQMAVWSAFEAGESIDLIAKASGCEVESVRAILREVRARKWLDQPIPFVDNELFSAPNADELILTVDRPAAPTVSKPAQAPVDLPAYLRSLYQLPLLSKAQEQDLFRRYNYLKYKMVSRIGRLEIYTVTEEELAALDQLADQVQAIKNEIVQANLRLVVSIAKKHVGSAPSFFEVVSDGNMSLMRAVENFDFARGNKFSTYASWAIMKNYARTIPEEHYHVTRFATGQEELLDASADHRSSEAGDLDVEHVRKLLAAGMAQLDERERTVVTHHFGLFGQGPAQTLEDLGKRFGVTKERIRQIESRAMSKLREVLAPSAFELLQF